MSEANKMYVLGYNDGVERAAQQCRFYAERTKDCNQKFVTAFSHYAMYMKYFQDEEFDVLKEEIRVCMNLELEDYIHAVRKA